MLAVCLLGVCLLAGPAQAEEPEAKAAADVKAEAPLRDRTALRAELAKEVAQVRAERRQELRTSDHTAAASAARERIADVQKKREAGSARREEARPALRDLLRENREEQREHRRSFIRRTM